MGSAPHGSAIELLLVKITAVPILEYLEHYILV
jgi:hypothetical protein